MLDRVAGNAAAMEAVKAALAQGRLSHSVLLLGEEGAGAGFCARCLAADWLYPEGGAAAEAVVRGEGAECLSVRAENKSNTISVDQVRRVRREVYNTALSAKGRAVIFYAAHRMQAEAANALLKVLEEPPAGVLFLLTATTPAAVLPTIRSRCAAYTIAPVPAADCAALLRDRGLPAALADELAFVYEGHVGNALRAFQDAAARTALARAKELCGYAAQNDTYRALALVTQYERDREGFLALLWQLDQVCSAVLRRPGYGASYGGIRPEAAADILRAGAETRRAVTANGNLRLAVALLAARIA